MPRVPYDPTKRAIRPQGQPRVNASGAINALGREASANRQIAGAVQGLISTGMEMRMDKIDEDTAADALRYENHATTAQMKFEAALDAIEVKDGVDFQAEADALKEEFIESLGEWVEAPGNVRHEQKHRLFQERNAAIGIGAKKLVGERVQAYERQRNIGAGQKGIETGTRLGDTDMIARGVRQLHLSKARGYGSADEADLMYDKHVKSMKQTQDQEDLTKAQNLLAEGEFQAFRETIDGLQLPTIEEKKKIKREMTGSHAFNAANLFLAELDTVEEVEAFRKDPEKFTGVKGLDDNRLRKIRYDAKKQEDRILRAQNENARQLVELAEKGEASYADFDQLREDDSASGLPKAEIDTLESLFKQAVDEYESGEEFKFDQTDPEYKQLLNGMSEAMFTGEDGEQITKDRLEDREKFLKRIEAFQGGSKAKAKLYSRYLQLKSQDLRSGAEDMAWLWGMGGREIKEPEQDFRIGVFREYQSLLREFGAPDGLGQKIETDDSTMRDFFKRNPNPSEEQLEKLRIDLILPVREKSMRRSVRGEVKSVSGLEVGTVQQGYRYLGGDPANPESWEVAK